MIGLVGWVVLGLVGCVSANPFPLMLMPSVGTTEQRLECVYLNTA